MNCKNCNAEADLNYCPNCGEATHIHRINGHYVFHEIQHVLHFEKGILYTIRELSIRPGDNVRHFLTGNRTRLVKPIIFLIVTSLIYTLIIHFFHIEEGYVQADGLSNTSTGHIFKWVQDHYGYANMLMGVFIAFWAKIFFKKYDYNFYEILILLCFVMGMGMLFFAIFSLIQGLTHADLLQPAGIVGVAYCSWAIGQFFDKKKLASYFKAFAAYMLGIISFTVAVILLGSLIDLVIKH